jgi:hypothetical protein
VHVRNGYFPASAIENAGTAGDNAEKSNEAMYCITSPLSLISVRVKFANSPIEFGERIFRLIANLLSESLESLQASHRSHDRAISASEAPRSVPCSQWKCVKRNVRWIAGEVTIRCNLRHVDPAERSAHRCYALRPAAVTEEPAILELCGSRQVRAMSITLRHAVV